MQEPRTHAQRAVPRPQSPDLEVELKLDPDFNNLLSARRKIF